MSFPGVLINATLCIDTVEVPGRGKVVDILGGAAAYFAAAARFYGPVRILGSVGSDYPDELWQQLQAMGLDLSGVERRAGETLRWHGSYHADLKNRDTLVVHEDLAVEAIPPLPDAWRDTAYVCSGVTQPTNQLTLQSQFPDALLIVLDTIDLYVREHRPKLLEAIAGAHGLVINDWEATQLTGEADATEAAQKLLGLGPRFAIVKRGEFGAVLAHSEGVWHCPAYPVKDLVDPTGAGDSFLGGFLGYMAEQNADAEDFTAIQQAMRHGTAAASFTIEDFSLRRLADLTREQIDERVAALT
ncbi:PfkB family carbohydrate kinase [Algisphaera agarilytica]|uniref:Sugar/nucleoside kinase (Ribokinase family) n=1 Tax=Algisphaera agarilytica TaxID=1385975 RepID=A0A7X0H9I3_9BACT|nr:PfkB family carbohydrate kinase [Algisphaera agarilytica]MBB6431563.1 sugar/nucleoside kinase (ribokinase family) [Algisphaera agarilytica]